MTFHIAKTNEHVARENQILQVKGRVHKQKFLNLEKTHLNWLIRQQIENKLPN